MNFKPEGFIGTTTAGVGVFSVTEAVNFLIPGVNPMVIALALCFLVAAAAFESWDFIASPKKLATWVIAAMALFPSAMGANYTQYRLRQNAPDIERTVETVADEVVSFLGVSPVVAQEEPDPDPEPRRPGDPW